MSLKLHMEVGSCKDELEAETLTCGLEGQGDIRTFLSRCCNLDYVGLQWGQQGGQTVDRKLVPMNLALPEIEFPGRLGLSGEGSLPPKPGCFMDYNMLLCSVVSDSL